MDYEPKKNTVSAIYLIGGKYDKELLEQSFDSVAWVDEIIHIDSSKYKSDFSELRNIGAHKSKCDWLLYVDTDEVVTPQLKALVLKSVASGKYAGYAIPRRNIVFGQEMKHCGLWPDYVLRLIKKDKLQGWHGELHEQPKVNGEVDHLNEAFIHYKHDKLSDMVEKTNKWSEIEGKLMFEASHPPMNFIRFTTAGIREFWLRMVVQTAFLDGPKGIIYALYQVFSRLISYSKLWELQLKYASGNS